MKGKYLSVGIGVSKRKNAFQASLDAAHAAVNDCGGPPNFSIVYTNSDYPQREILRGINKVLGSDWIGVSADKQFNNFVGYDEELVVSVLCLKSDYLHFGVGVAENYKKNPKESAKVATAQAMREVNADRYVDAYVQFTRIKKHDYYKIVRTPPYFILAFASGAKFIKGKAIPGQESEFVSGILEYTGPHVPIFGGSASSSFEKYLEESKGENTQFANGKMYSDAGVVVFCICNLYFATGVEHGYVSSNQYAAITKLDKSGYEILEINNKEPVAEYARLLGISKQEYLKDPSKYSLTRPFGLVGVDGTTHVKEALPNPDRATLHSTFKLNPNSVMNILDYDEKRTLDTMRIALKKYRAATKSPISISLFCSCSGRRPLLAGRENEVVQHAIREIPKTYIFGFDSFGEVGATENSSAQSYSQTVTSLVLYDTLLSE